MNDDQTPARLFRLDGEVALVTGAGRGIGRIAATTLAQAGATVAVTDLRGEHAEEVAREITEAGGMATASTLDVSDEQAIVAVIGDLVGRFGRIDVLVNNAGVGNRRPTTLMTTSDWRKVFAVNVEGTFVCAREAGRHMLERRSGRIINVASIMGMVGGGLYPNLAYNTSKGAIVNMTRALAAEWAPMGVRVNAIAPTFVNTEMTTVLRTDVAMRRKIEDRTPMGRFAEPEEMAGGILYLASAASGMVTGHILAIDGGWLAI